MGSEERDGRALALSLLVVIAHRPNRDIGVTVREGQEDPLIFSCCFVKCTKNIAKGSVGAMDKDGRIVLNRRDSITQSIPPSNSHLLPQFEFHYLSTVSV